MGERGEGGTPRGLSATELRAAIEELRTLCGAALVDAVPLAVVPPHDDLLLVLSEPEGRKRFVHVALGGTRARLATTVRRFDRSFFRRQQSRDVLRRELEHATLEAIETAEGERRSALVFRTGSGAIRRLVVELFGARGLWALLDEGDRVLLLSRAVETAVRCLRAGDVYRAPPSTPTKAGSAGAPGRFSAPVLEAIDAHFTAADRHAEKTREFEVLQHAANRAQRRARDREAGLRRQLDAGARTGELRARADLMLAYAHTAARGASRLNVIDPETGAPLELELDPRRTVAQQAEALYDKARRLEDGRAVTESRLREATAKLEALTRIADEFAGPGDPAEQTGERLAGLRADLERLGALPAAPKPRPARGPKARPTRPGENFRRFVSAEGYVILVGRSNAQNDRLTMHVANGNDLWLHVGGGRAGSHVVVRLPKQKTASLETLLDAAALAVHFSKARGEPRIEVVYTFRKHVRKPKGLPPGAVVPSQTRTVPVNRDEGRLRRLLDSAGEDD